MSWCKTCGEFIFTYSGVRPHKCPPTWLVKIPDWHDEDDADDAFTVFARDKGQAAEKAVERYDEQGDLAFDDVLEVRVLIPETGEWEKISVSKTFSVDYNAED
jgi:hypothetical protein